jgi:hypothetical protein
MAVDMDEDLCTETEPGLKAPKGHKGRIDKRSPVMDFLWRK